MEILITRHGQTDWNVQKKIQGKVDIELNETGKEQARKTAKLLENENIDLIICSPLKRALQTAEIINETKNVPIIIDERISERCFGDYEGVNDLAFPFDEFWGFSIERDFKGAEGLKEFFDRVYGFLDDIREIHKDKKILLVTHGGVSIPTKCYFNGIPDRKTFFDLCIGNCEIVKFEYK